MDDWGDISSDAKRLRRRSAQPGGLSREQRFSITLAVTAVAMLALGLVLGVVIGRATAAKAEARSNPPARTVTRVEPPPVEPAPVVEPTPTVEATVAPEPLDAPSPSSPDDGDRINADTVALKWSEVTDPSGQPVTYTFEIETYRSGKYTDSQTIDGLTTNSYPKARVLTNTRRWRVWAVGSDGRLSAKSDWMRYRHTAVTPKPVTPKPSTDTSSHT